MFALWGPTTPGGQARRQLRPPAFFVLALFALSLLLVLLSGCGTLGSDTSTVTAPEAWKGSPLGPQDLRFDGRGFLWFTAEAGGAIGQLDPETGAIRLWPLPSPASGVLSYPDSLIVTPNGRVWFGDYAGGAIGNLDPTTGQITLYDLPDPQVQVFSMAADTAGRIWFTEVLPGKLGMFDPATDTVTELPVPAIAGKPPALYELVIDHQDTIWFVDVGANTLVRYSPGKQTLVFFQLSLPSSAPFGLTLDPAGRLWFTAGGSSANYVGKMTA